MTFPFPRRSPALILTALILFLCILTAGRVGSLSAQEATPTPSERFSFRGDMLVRSFFLERDLPLKSVSVNTTSRVREEQDFYSARFRLDLAFRPSPNVDILWGSEVGELTFGRDNASRTGPGTGGKGAGASNVETRELIMKIRNNPESRSLSLGILNFDTPRGLVLATSGAGGRFFSELPALSSSIDMYYIRAEDNSVIDGDSNGFSDTNFNDINTGIVRYKFNGIKNLRAELYSVYRQDDDPSAVAGDGSETSRIYWGGLFAQYKFGLWGFLFHAVGNWGQFHRPDPAAPALRKRRNVNAGAGQAEITFQPFDEFTIGVTGAGGSGRLGKEPDGSSVDYRPDQFRVAGSAFQLTDIALDSSGGYTLFAGGRLTGVTAAGLLIKTTIFETIQAEFTVFDIRLYRTPTIDYNALYTRYPEMHQPDNRLGVEWNAKFSRRLITDFLLEARFAYFDAADGYRILNDVRYGDDIVEASIAVTQKF